MTNFTYILEILGTIAFAVSGAVTGIHKKMDIFGVVILGMTTAVGGGILRDVTLGITPPRAFRSPSYALVAILVSLIIFLPGLRNRFDSDGKIQLMILLMDTIGLGVFTVIGANAGMRYGSAFLSVFMGVLTGVGGGVLRDLFAGDRPYIFVKHFYATASLIGAVLMVLIWPRDKTGSMIAGAVAVIVLRLLAARYHWNLPHA